MNLVSPVAREELERLPAPSDSDSDVACQMGRPGTAGVGRDAEEANDAAMDLDHEQHVVTTQHHAVDGPR